MTPLRPGQTKTECGDERREVAEADIAKMLPSQSGQEPFRIHAGPVYGRRGPVRWLSSARAPGLLNVFDRKSLAAVLLVLTGCTKEAPMPAPAPPEDSRMSAIGSRAGLPASLARALDPAPFTPLGKPGPMDWLANQREPGQTFLQYRQSWPNRPDAQRHVIYLQPLGTFGAEAPSLELLRAYAAAFFMMDVRVLPAMPIDGTITKRINSSSGQSQLLTTDLLTRLRAQLPSDAFCLLGVTMEDLYPSASWNFVFGQASLTDRVGVYSFARYGGASKELMLRRSFKVLSHETGHMFGVAHCIWYGCVMNGSNHLAETDARPMHLCPVDLRKLHWNIRFDVVERDRRLRAICAEAGLEDEVQWIDAELGRVD